MRDLIELSNSELNGKTVMEYLKENYDTVEKRRGNHYTLNGHWVEVLTENDKMMKEIIRKSFFRCYHSGKMGIDTTEIKKMINDYLEKDNEIDNETIGKYLTTKYYGMTMVDDEINDWLSTKRYEYVEMYLY